MEREPRRLGPLGRTARPLGILNVRIPASLSGPPARRLGWQTADQIASSASNYIFTLVAARVLAPSEFGQVALILSTWTLLLGLTRNLVGQPLIVHAEMPGEHRRASAGRFAAWLALATGSATALSLIAARLFDIGSAVLPVGIAAVGLACTQDILRYLCIAEGRVKIALWSDLTWLVVTVTGLLLATAGRPTATGVAAAWAGGALAGALYVANALRVPLKGAGTKGGVRLLATGSWFALSGLLYSLSAYLWTLILVMRAGTAGLGSLRAFMAMIAPLSLAAMTAELWGMQEMSRSPRSARLVGVISVMAAAPYAALLSLAAPAGSTLTRLILGADYAKDAVLLLPVTIAALLGALATGPVVGLRVGKRGRHLAVSQLLSGPLRVAAAFTAGPGSLAPCAWWTAAAEGLRLSVLCLSARSGRARGVSGCSSGRPGGDRCG